MTVTMRIVNLVDKLKLQKYFVQKDNRVHLKFVEFNPQRIEGLIDSLLRTKGNNYEPDPFEQSCMKELDF